MIHDDSEAKPLYFGNDNKHSEVVEKLEDAIKNRKSKLHIISGGPSTGKSYAVAMTKDGMGTDKFDLLVDPDQLAENDIPHDVPREIVKLLREMNDEKRGAYVQHHVYKRHGEPSEKPFYVVIADGETPPADPKGLQLLLKAGDLVRKAKEGEYDLLWIADAPIREQAIPIFKASTGAQKEMTAYNKGIATIKQKLGSAVAVHELKYDMDTIKEILWDNIRSGGPKFLTQLRGTTHKTEDVENNQQWEKATKAALQNDREAYEKVFNGLKKRVRTGNNRAA